MTTALMKIGGGLTVGDLLLIELPHLAPDVREFVLWEYTGWPMWFAYTNEKHWLTVLREQLQAARGDHA